VRARRSQRLEGEWQNLRLIHLPYPRGLAQPDRDLLLDPRAQSAHPHDFHSLDKLAERIIGFQQHWQQVAAPIDWKCTRP
jgi:hypothetical protein